MLMIFKANAEQLCIYVKEQEQSLVFDQRFQQKWLDKGIYKTKMKFQVDTPREEIIDKDETQIVL